MFKKIMSVNVLKFVLILAIIFIILLFNVTGNSFAEGRRTNVNTKDGGVGRWCTTGNCYNTDLNGAFWIKVPMNGKKRTISDILSDKNKKVAYVTKYQTVSRCKKDVYIFVSRLSKGGLAGAIDSDTVKLRKDRNGWDKKWKPSDATIVTDEEAEDEFNKYKRIYE